MKEVVQMIYVFRGNLPLVYVIPDILCNLKEICIVVRTICIYWGKPPCPDMHCCVKGGVKVQQTRITHERTSLYFLKKPINWEGKTNTVSRIPFQIWVVSVTITNKATTCSHCAVNSRGDVRGQKSTMIVARHNTIEYCGCTCDVCDLEAGKACVC